MLVVGKNRHRENMADESGVQESGVFGSIQTLGEGNMMKVVCVACDYMAFDSFNNYH